MDEEEFIQEEYNPQKETYTESIKFSNTPFTTSVNPIKEAKVIKPANKKPAKKLIIEEADYDAIEEKPKPAKKKHVEKKHSAEKPKENTKKETSENKSEKSVEEDDIELSFGFIKKMKKFFKKNKKESNKTKASSIIALIALFAIIGICVLILNLDKIFPDKGTSVAIVNGEAITTKDIENTFKTVPSMYKPLLKEEEILNQTIINKLLLQEAAKAGIAATNDEAEAVIDKTLAVAQMSKNDFKAYLKGQNLTYDEMLEFYRTNIAIEKLLQATAYVGINVSAEEIKEFYNNNSEDLANISLESIEGEIENFLLQQKKTEASNKYISALIASASITILNKEEPVSFESSASSIEVEKYAKCASDNGLDKSNVIFIYSDSCPHCQRMKPVVTELEKEDYKFKWASVYDSEAKALMTNCYSDVLAGGVPQFICAKNGQTVVGEQSKEALKSFAESCNK